MFFRHRPHQTPQEERITLLRRRTEAEPALWPYQSEETRNKRIATTIYLRPLSSVTLERPLTIEHNATTEQAIKLHAHANPRPLAILNENGSFHGYFAPPDLLLHQWKASEAFNTLPAKSFCRIPPATLDSSDTIASALLILHLGQCKVLPILDTDRILQGLFDAEYVLKFLTQQILLT